MQDASNMRLTSAARKCRLSLTGRSPLARCIGDGASDSWRSQLGGAATVQHVVSEDLRDNPRSVLLEASAAIAVDVARVNVRAVGESGATHRHEPGGRLGWLQKPKP